jgi:hypothetical protein
MLAEGAAREAPLAGRTTHADNANLGGVSAPVGFICIGAPPP